MPSAHAVFCNGVCPDGCGNFRESVALPSPTTSSSSTGEVEFLTGRLH